MTVEERLTQLMDEGAVINIGGFSAVVERVIVGALWWEDPRRLRWSEIFPEDQHHVHETMYDVARLSNEGRDVLFFLGGDLVAGVTPVLESSLNTDEVREQLTEWKATLAYGDNTAQFDRFLATA